MSNLFCECSQDEQTLLINFNLNKWVMSCNTNSTWGQMSHDHNWANGSWNLLWYALNYKHVSGMNYSHKPRFYLYGFCSLVYLIFFLGLFSMHFSSLFIYFFLHNRDHISLWKLILCILCEFFPIMNSLKALF